jgi:hypothetical protein
VVRFGKYLPFKMLPIELPIHLRSRPVGIITLKNRMLGPVARLFVDCAHKTARALAKSH